MIGRLRTRVTHQTQTTASDGVGGQTVTWVDGQTFWAEVLGGGSRETLSVGALTAPDGYVVTMRYSSAVAVTHRLAVSGGQTLEIVGLRDTDGRKRWLELQCQVVR